jgi:hypothetical protein
MSRPNMAVLLTLTILGHDFHSLTGNWAGEDGARQAL